MSLDMFEAKRSDDDVKTDLELTCIKCSTHLCDIEDSDSLGTLVGLAEDHVRTCGGGKTYDHESYPDSGPEEGDWCKTCGEKITWVGPGQYDYLHVNDKENQ